MSKDSTKPLPPKHSMASYATAGARLQIQYLFFQGAVTAENGKDAD